MTHTAYNTRTGEIIQTTTSRALKVAIKISQAYDAQLKHYSTLGGWVFSHQADWQKDLSKKVR